MASSLTNFSYKVVLAYDGGAYHGWQRQLGLPTVQGMLEAAIERVSGETPKVQGCGRTDQGVHALGQTASFTLSKPWAPLALRRALNAVLPADIRVVEAADVRDGFNALDDAIGKRYRYQIDDGDVGDLFQQRYRWKVWCKLNENAMHAAGQKLVGLHDFASFQTTGSPRLSTVRHVRDVVVLRRGRGGDCGFVDVEIEANGFLYQMVRGIVGTLYEVGRGAKPVEWIDDVLRAKDRRAAGMNAPAHGLFLLRAFYSGDETEDEYSKR